MSKSSKINKIFALTLLSSVLMLAILIPTIVSAQGQGSVTLLASIGGTTDPEAGLTTNYDAGTAVTLTATPNDGFVFFEWQIVTANSSYVVSDNPYTLTVSADTDYAIQPMFELLQTVPEGTPVTDYATAAIVVVLAAAGGTTTPQPGKYALNSAEQLELTAIPDSGFQFAHWVITGTPMSHGAYSFTDTPTDNPYTVDHGYGNTYAYQPVFIPIGSTEPTPTPTAAPGIGGLSMETTVIIGLVAVIIVILIAFAIFAMRKSKK